MIVLRQFPDLSVPDVARRFLAAWWSETLVMHASVREARYQAHPGPLSVKCAFGGRETYEIAGRRLPVHDGCWLALREGTVYSSSVESDATVESLCVMFSAADVRAGAALDDEAILERREVAAPAVYEQVHPARGPVFGHVMRLRRLRDAAAIEEEVHALLAAFLRMQDVIRRQVAKLPARRVSTRAELYRRLQRARDLIESRFDEPLRLGDLAHAACLQKHHFLREFARAFGTTPHRYLVRRRLDAARRLLAKRGASVLRACLEVGFADPSAFARAFQQRYGTPPSIYGRKTQFLHGNGGCIPGRSAG